MKYNVYVYNHKLCYNIIMYRVLLLSKLDSNSLHPLRTGNNVPSYRISARGAPKKPFSVSEKCGTGRQTTVSEKRAKLFVQNVLKYVVLEQIMSRKLPLYRECK